MAWVPVKKAVLGAFSMKGRVEALESGGQSPGRGHRQSKGPKVRGVEAWRDLMRTVRESKRRA